MRAPSVVVLLLLAAIAVDFAVLSDGAFRFNTDESMVGVRADARVAMPAPTRPAIAGSLDRPRPRVITRPGPAHRPDVVARPDAPAARSRLVVSAADQPSEAH